MKKKPNASVRGYLAPRTVRVRKDGALRVGQDLLGNLAGDRNLRFSISLSGDVLSLRPRIGKFGYPVFYPQSRSKSPTIRMASFYRLMSLVKFREGVYPAESRKGNILCYLKRRSRV